MQDRLSFASRVRVEARTRAAHGFEPRTEGGWTVLVDRARGARGPAGLGRPGLWRDVDGARAFELPPLAFEGSGDAGGHLPLDASLLEWAAATADGGVPEGWQPPSRAEVEGWIGARQLIAGSGARVTLGVIVCEPRRLALTFPNLARTPAVQAPTARVRAAWLAEICAAVEGRWRLVRCGCDSEGRVRAEVDLSGVSMALAPELVRLSFEALLCAVEWVLPSLHVVVDPGVASGVLGRRPPRA